MTPVVGAAKQREGEREHARERWYRKNKHMRGMSEEVMNIMLLWYFGESVEKWEGQHVFLKIRT